MKGVLHSLIQIGRKLVEPKFTREYPEEPLQLPPASRVRIILTSDPDGEERCVACGLCAAVCPVDCIAMDKAERQEGPLAGRWFPEMFEVNLARCIFCGLCEEACPTAAIQLAPDPVAPVKNRRDLVFQKADLLVSHQGKAPGVRYWARAGKGHPPDPAADPWNLMP